MTTYTTKELKGKNEAELGAIAEELGLQLNVEALNKNDLITEIVQAYEEDKEDNTTVQIEVVDEEEEAAAAKPKVEKKYRLIISNQDGVDQTSFVKVQVNGLMYTVPRETEVVVPESVIEVLKNAVVSRYVDEGGEWVERKGKRFPYTVLGTAR